MLFRRKRTESAAAPAAAPDPQAPPSRSHGRAGRARIDGVRATALVVAVSAAAAAGSTRSSRRRGSRSTATSTPPTATRSSPCSAAAQSRVLVQSDRHLAVDQAGDRRDRGQALLRAPRHRHPRHGARAAARTSEHKSRGAGRLDDHAAVREERADRRRPVDHAQAEGGGARVELEQNWTKDRILTAYLNTIYFGNGAYGVERASRTYFGHSAQEADAAGGGAARRHSRGPEPVRPGRAPAGGAENRRRDGAAADAAAADHQRPASSGTRSRAPMPKPQNVHLSGVRGPGAVLRRVREAAAALGQAVRREARLRRRLPRAHDDRPRPAEARARGDRQVAAEHRPGRRPRSSRSTRRTAPSLAMYGGRELPREPVQPRRAGRAAARARRSSRSCSRPR